MSCYIPYQDLETTLFQAYKSNFNKYKNLSAVIADVLGLDIASEAKIHAIWYYAGYVNTVANKIEGLQTDEWKSGVYEMLHNYLAPYLTGKKEFNYQDIVKDIQEMLPSEIEVEEPMSLIDRILSDIGDISKVANISLSDSVNEIIDNILSNQLTIDSTDGYIDINASKGLLNSLMDQLKNRNDSPLQSTLLNRVAAVLADISKKGNEAVNYVDTRNLENIGIYNGTQIELLRRANGDVFEVVYDRPNQTYRIYNPGEVDHLTPVTLSPGDLYTDFYFKDNSSVIDPATGDLRFNLDDVATGLAIGSTNSSQLKGKTIQEFFAENIPTGVSFNSAVKIVASKKIIDINNKRLERLHKLSPSLRNRSVMTEERPSQSKILAIGKSPILTTIKPNTGFTITVSNRTGDLSFDIESLADLAFLYSDNTVEMVDIDNPQHINMLRGMIQVKNKFTEKAKRRYSPITDEQLDSFIDSIRRVKEFQNEVNEAIKDNNDTDISDIFYKYFQLNNSVVYNEYISGNEVESGLDEHIEQHGGQLTVKLQTYDEEGNPIGTAESGLVPVVYRKGKNNSWIALDTLQKNQKIIGKDGKAYSDVDAYLTQDLNIPIKDILKPFVNRFAAYISVRPTSTGELSYTVIPLVYRREVQSPEDLVNMAVSFGYSFKYSEKRAENNVMAQLNNKYWGFNVSKKTGIFPQITLDHVDQNGNKHFAITMTMLTTPSNTEEERKIFNAYAKKKLTIPLNNEIFYGENGLFKTLSKLYELANVKVKKDATLDELIAASEKAIQKLGAEHPLVQVMKLRYSDLVKNIRAGYQAISNAYDEDALAGLEPPAAFSPENRKYLLFDDQNVLMLNNRKGAFNSMKALKKLKNIQGVALTLSSKEPNRSLRVPKPVTETEKVEPSVPVIITPSVKEPPAKSTDDASFDPNNAEPTDPNDIAFSMQESLVQHLTLNEEQFSKEIAALKSLIPDQFVVNRFTSDQVNGFVLGEDTDVLGYVQGLMINLNNTIKSQGVAYHEGFHAIFRNILTTQEQEHYLREVAKVLGDYKTDANGKYIEVNGQKIYASDFARKRRFIHLTDEQIKNFIYEEYLADGFADFIKNNNIPHTWLQRLFAYLKRLFNLFKKGGVINSLYYDISLGKFKNAVVRTDLSNSRSNIAYSLDYRGIPAISYNAKGQKEVRNLIIPSDVVSEVSNKMIDTMIQFKIQNPELKDSELYDMASTKVANEYNIKNLTSQAPEIADQISEAYDDFYNNAKWLLGRFHNSSDTFTFKNYTQNSEDDGVIIDKTGAFQTNISKSTAEEFKKETLRYFNTLDIIRDTEDTDEQEEDDINDDKEYHGESFEDAGIGSGKSDQGNAAFRKMFMFIPYEYTDPRFGIKRTKMVDSKLIFSTITKISSDLNKDEIIPTIVKEVDRLSETIDYMLKNVRPRIEGYEIPEDLAKMINLRDSLRAVYNRIATVTGLSEKGTASSNAHILEQFVKVFNTVNLQLMQVELNTVRAFPETKQGEEAKAPEIVGQNYYVSDIVVISDIAKIVNALKDRFYLIRVPADKAENHLKTLREVDIVLASSSSINERLMDNDVINDVKLRKFIDNIYIATSAFNLGIPYNAIEMAIAYNVGKIVANSRATKSKIFADGSKFLDLLKFNKGFYRDFENIEPSFFSTTLPNTISAAVGSTEIDKIQRSNRNLEEELRRLTTAYRRGFGEFIIKYDPSIAGSVTKDANGNTINKYVKPTNYYVTNLKLHSKPTISEGLADVIDSYFPGDTEYFNDNPMFDLDNPKVKRFWELFKVSAFAGFRQSFLLNNQRTDKDGTTFRKIDDRAYTLSMFGLFANRTAVYVPGDTPLETFKRIATVFESTSTSMVVDGMFKNYFDESGKVIKDASGTFLFVKDLEQILRQEYNLIKRNFESERSGQLGKEYIDYNTPEGARRGFTFNILRDFFATDVAASAVEGEGIVSDTIKKRVALRTQLIAAAESGKSFELLDPETIKNIELLLKDFGIEQYKNFDSKLKSLGINDIDLPTTLVYSGNGFKQYSRITPAKLKADFFYNAWINGALTNQLFEGIIGKGTKNFAHYFKRQKTGAAAGDSLFVLRSRKPNYKVAVHKKFIYYIDTADLTKPAQLTPFKDTDGNDLSTNKKIEIFDGQSFQTVDRKMAIADAQGLLDDEVISILSKMRYDIIHTKQYAADIRKLRAKGIVFNSVKTVSSPGYQYIKQSEHTLLRAEVSHLKAEDSSNPEAIAGAMFDLKNLYARADYYRSQYENSVDDGKDYKALYQDTMREIHSYFEPNKSTVLLHNILNSMEMSMVDQFIDESASKRATIKPYQGDLIELSTKEGYMDFGESVDDIPNDLTFVQVATDHLDELITHAIQQKLLIISQLDENDPAYAAIKSDIATYKKSLADFTRIQLDKIKRVLNTNDEKLIGKIYTKIASSLRKQGASSAELQYFEVDENGNPKKAPSIPLITNTLIYYYFSIFNQNIFDKKISGRKFYHVSPLGHELIVKDGKIIPRDEYLKNPEAYKDATTRLPSIIKNEDGTYTVEVIVPKGLTKSEQKLLEEKISKFCATRIPTEGRRSMVSAKIVDFMDEAYGNGIIMPYQMHMLAGSDFDIDSLYAYTYSTYKAPDGEFVVYGDYSHYKEKYNMSDSESKFVEYLSYMSNDELVSELIDNELSRIEQQGGYKLESTKRFAEYFKGNIEKYLTKVSNVRNEQGKYETKEDDTRFKRLLAVFNILENLSNSDLPTSPAELEEYTKKNGTPVTEIILNQSLTSKINILSNPTVSESILTGPTADQAVAVYNKLCKLKGLSEQQVYNQNNLYTPTALIVARGLNSESKDSLGIAASWTKGVSMLATIKAETTHPISTLYEEVVDPATNKTVVKPHAPLNKIADDSVIKIGGAIGLFADAPSNPYPGPLNLTTITTPVMLCMYALGVPQEAAIMFQSLAPIKAITAKYNATGGSAYSRDPRANGRRFTGFFKDQLIKMFSDNSEAITNAKILDEEGKIDDSQYKLIWTGDIKPDTEEDGMTPPISNNGFKLVNTKGEPFEKNVEDLLILREFYKYLTSGNDISFGITPLTDPMKSLRPDQIVFDRLLNTYKTAFSGKHPLFSKATIDNLRKTYPVLDQLYDALKYMDNMSKRVLIERTSFMKGMVSLMSNFYGWNADKKTVISDLKSFIGLQVQQAELLKNPDNEFAKIYLEMLNPSKFINGDVVKDYYTLKNLFPNNEFLRALRVVTEGTGSNEVRLLEIASSKLTANAKDRIFTDALYLMGHPDIKATIDNQETVFKVKQMMYRLAIHGMIKSGAQKSVGGYFELMPALILNPMSGGLSVLHNNLVKLDDIITKKYKPTLNPDTGVMEFPIEAYQEYKSQMNEIMKQSFNGESFADIINKAIVKIASYRLNQTDKDLYKTTVSIGSINKRMSSQEDMIGSFDVKSLVSKILGKSASNIISGSGQPIRLNIGIASFVKSLKETEYELFTPSGNEVEFNNMSGLNNKDQAILKAAGIYSAGKDQYKFPLYKVNIYGQLLVLKSLNNKPLGEIFIDTVSESELHNTNPALSLVGSSAVYQIAPREGTAKISPLAFTSDQGAELRNRVEGIQALTSYKIESIPAGFRVVRSANKAVEFQADDTKATQNLNKTYRLYNNSLIHVGNTFESYFFYNNKLYKRSQSGAQSVVPDSEYDKVASYMNQGSWENLKNNPGFAQFLNGTGVAKAIVYDLVNGDPITAMQTQVDESGLTAPKVSAEGERSTQQQAPVTETTTEPIAKKVVEGDIFTLPGIPVITTNLEGVHGAGLAQAAKAKGLITQGDGNFKATDKVVQLPVKGRMPGTRRPGTGAYSESVTGKNIELLEEGLRSLIAEANTHPERTYLLPLAGLGHGEGSIEEILPLLIKTVKAVDNITLVLPAQNVSLGRQGTVRKDYTRENMPQIKAMLEESGLLPSQLITRNEELDRLREQQQQVIEEKQKCNININK